MDKVGKAIVVLLLMLISAFFGGGWIFSGFYMATDAMEGAIGKGDLVLVNRLALGSRDPKRGEVVVFRIPGEEGSTIRRVIGLPGETVEMRASELFINGARVEEPWLVSPSREGPAVEVIQPISFGPFTVGENKYFLVGDDRTKGNDSRTFGAVQREQIYGTIWGLFGPLTF